MNYYDLDEEQLSKCTMKRDWLNILSPQHTKSRHSEWLQQAKKQLQPILSRNHKWPPTMRENWKSEKQQKWELRNFFKSEQKLVGTWLGFRVSYGHRKLIGTFRFHLNTLSISECHASTVKNTCLDKLLPKTHLKDISVKVMQSHFK